MTLENFKNNLISCLVAGCLFFCFQGSFAQQAGSETTYPLKEALTKIENRFGVDLAYSNELVGNRPVKQNGWMSEEGLEQSLLQLLSPLHLMFQKEGNNRYRIVEFEVDRRSPEVGRAQLEYLSIRYSNKATWEQRKKELRTCMFKALKLSPLPEKPDSEPIITSRRTMNGYTVENIAIETLPGFFVTGSLYRPSEIEGKVPVILSPNGHFEDGRFRPDQQYRMATLARMGAMVFSYDLFGWGESQLFVDPENHRTGLAMSVQALNGIRILDFLTAFEEADPNRVGITGGSGGGSQTMLLTALDQRIDVSVPVVMLSSYFNGGCPCESGRPVHYCGGGTSNAEISAMAVPRPQLIISDGDDWTAHVPEIAYPYLQKIYGYYGRQEAVKNIHLPEEGHDYGRSKRVAMYEFMADHLDLDIENVRDERGEIDESECTIEEKSKLYVFGRDGENIPDRATRDIKILQRVFEGATEN